MSESAEHSASAVDRAIEKAGGASAVARAFGISPQAVGQWKRIPAERVLALEALSGISRHLLRPDIYPATEGRAA